jgi:transcriptional regulator GlxA family with amidase domain
MHAFSSAIEPLRIANRRGVQDAYDWLVGSVDGAPVTASNGVVVVADFAMDALQGATDLVVLAGWGAIEQDFAFEVAWLRRQARSGCRIIGLSSGVVVLARAGLLDGKRASAHWEDMLHITENHPRIELSHCLFETDGRITTCAGGAAASDMMIAIIAADHGVEIAHDVAMRLIVDRVRDGRAQQGLPASLRFHTSEQRVLEAITIMEANLEEPLPVSEIARLLGLGQRQLERLFARNVDGSPRVIYERLRLDRARHLVLQGSAPITEIALDCGFESPSRLSRAYRKRFGVSPSGDRMLLRSPPSPQSSLP